MKSLAKILDNRHRVYLIIGAEAEMELIENELEIAHTTDDSDRRYHQIQKRKAEKKLEVINKRISDIELSMEGLEF